MFRLFTFLSFFFYPCFFSPCFNQFTFSAQLYFNLPFLFNSLYFPPFYAPCFYIRLCTVSKRFLTNSTFVFQFFFKVRCVCVTFFFLFFCLVVIHFLFDFSWSNCSSFLWWLRFLSSLFWKWLPRPLLYSNESNYHAFTRITLIIIFNL